MSVFFKIDEETVWNPALRVGLLFVAQIGALEEYAGIESGFDAMAADYFIIDGDKFETLIAELASGRHNFGAATLMRGVIEVSIVMLARVGRTPHLGTDFFGDPARLVEEFGPQMAR